MTLFLSIQNTYHNLEIALFDATTCIDATKDDKRHASKNFVPLLDNLLITNNLTLKDLSFITVNQGPGPFTTLRIVIASVNGLSFASGIPLIGIDGLEAFVQEHHNPQYPNTVILLNAFSQDVYFAIAQKNQMRTGYKQINVLLDELREQFPDGPIRFLGNATDMYREPIAELFGERAYIPDPVPQICSVQHVGLMGLDKWQAQQGVTDQLYPLYLKKHHLQQ